MGKLDDKFARAAHIKRHTVGTSNEISFSVLDAAKNQLEGPAKADPDARTSRFGHISLFTLPLGRKKAIGTPVKERGLPLSDGGFASAEAAAADKAAPSAVPGDSQVGRLSKTRSAGTSLALPTQMRTPEEEISRRKARRRLRRILAASLVVVIGLALAGAGGLYLYHDHQQHAAQVSQLDGALDLVKQADETMVALDALVASPLSTESLTDAKTVLQRLPETTAQLKEADQVVRDVSASLRESRDKEAANQSVAAVAARLAMIEAGEQIVEAALAANEAAKQASAAWQDVLSADALAREAAALVTDTTDEHVTASKEKTEAAVAALAEAQDALLAAASAYPDADLTAALNYVAKRIEALNAAIASDEALLAKNKDEAFAQNDAYTRADAEAATMAAELPSDLTRTINETFERETAPLTETYSTARSQAGSADAFIRDYLGTTIK
ncbi:MULTISPECIES: hypothetical protein [Gordonibacter]|uniref:Uncharacterized protein n=1 Tax=Gordonibacter faecis TaxID=3047475 RepID=A0ABT7DKC5_9ACTN|nr:MULTISPECIES: hypothetical protein [unclassified Gordonibacter]MDJ1649978.1 hypothetical protein [Gordonibacter sp. KGMB12511]HIW76701.1 hypothetical protein [Candidatus Gordonibacter avicola]